MATDIDEYDFIFRYHHFNGDAVFQVDRDAVESGEFSAEPMQAQGWVMRVKFKELECFCVLGLNIRVLFQKLGCAPVVLLGKYELPAH